FLQSNNWN
ncbi:vscA, partial [Vibrio harveyi]